MRFGLDVINAGYFANPRHMVNFAQAAEASGWEGLFIWDHLAFVWGIPSGDPWVILSAVAATTDKLLIGPAVTPVARRRPQVLAQHLVSLDLLSNGRTIFGAGLGGVAGEFTAFGEPFEPKTVAAMLDEGLDVIDGLLSGEPQTHHGAHYTLQNVTLQPKPVQLHIPIWVGGTSKPALRRAARWDGWILGVHDEDGGIGTPPEKLAQQIEFIQQHRENPSKPFDVVLIGNSEPGSNALIKEFEDAGATWWLESLHERRDTPDKLLERVQAGRVTW